MKYLSEFRKIAGLTQEQLAKKLNISRAAINHYENNEREPSFETLRKMTSIFNCTLDELINGIKNPKRAGVKIPVLGTIPAGIPIEAIEEILDYEEIDGDLASTGDFFALRVKGDSMAPRICDKDVVIIKQQEEVRNNDIAVVLVNGNDATLKRVKVENNGLWLIPDNEQYGAVFYTAQQVQSLPIKIIGKAVEIRGKL